MASFFCSTKFFLVLLLISAVPLAVIVRLETAEWATNVFEYHSTGWMRECAKWDDLHRRFIVTFMEGGVGQIRVPDDYSPGTVLDEIPVVKDADVAGNSSLGFTIDRPRNRIVVAIADVLGNMYSAVAAYDLSTWKRLFLTRLSGPEDGKAFADDVAVDAEGNAYITDIKQSRIWKVGPDGEFLYTIRSPLFIPKEWYKNLIAVNGIVYHPNGYLLVIHTFSGNLYKIELGKEEGEVITVVSLAKGHSLKWGDGLELLSATQLVVVSGTTTRLVESSDDWETARIAGVVGGFIHRLSTAATVKDGKVYLNHMIGLGYPRKKHILVEAAFN